MKKIWVGLAAAAVFSSHLYAQEPQNLTVSALDHAGKALRQGLAFYFDEENIVCAYSVVKDADTILVQLNGSKMFTRRLISFNEPLDIAVLRVQEDPEQEQAPAISFITPAMGDVVYYRVKQGNDWRMQSATIKTFADTGKGFFTILLQAQGPGSFEPSPLFDSQKKIVGWLNQPDSGVPLGAIVHFIDKEASVSLSEIDVMKKFWPFQKMEIKAAAGTKPELSEMMAVDSAPPFSFRVDFPKNWKFQKISSPGKLLVRAADEQFGLSTELRIMPAESEDLITNLERAETLILPRMLRADLIPYSVDHLTGFKALYEDVEQNMPYSLEAFFTVSRGNFYFLSVSYPAQYKEQAGALLDQIAGSFRIPAK